VVSAEEAYLGLPSLQSQVRFSLYRVTLAAQALSPQLLGERVQALLATCEAPYEQCKQEELKVFDLRPLIDDIWIEEIRQNEYDLAMRLRTDSQATGRPDHVLQVLGLAEAARSIHRVRLLLGMHKPPTDPQDPIVPTPCCGTGRCRPRRGRHFHLANGNLRSGLGGYGRPVVRLRCRQPGDSTGGRQPH
jgi:hypothetical protein